MVSLNPNSENDFAETGNDAVRTVHANNIIPENQNGEIEPSRNAEAEGDVNLGNGGNNDEAVVDDGGILENPNVVVQLEGNAGAEGDENLENGENNDEAVVAGGGVVENQNVENLDNNDERVIYEIYENMVMFLTKFIKTECATKLNGTLRTEALQLPRSIYQGVKWAGKAGILRGFKCSGNCTGNVRDFCSFNGKIFFN